MTFLWLTLMESFGYANDSLCYGTLNAEGRPVYLAHTNILGHESGDSLACLVWAWHERPRITCNVSSNNGNSTQRIVTGGHWTQDSAEGRYRVVLADVDDWNHSKRAVVQWLRLTGQGTMDSVAAMAELPDEINTFEPPSPHLAQIAGHWLLIATSTERTFWGRARRLTYRLGPPGEVLLQSKR